MPVPGPRTQSGSLPGYRNPRNPGIDEPQGLIEYPERFNHWLRPPPVAVLGRTPTLQYVNLRGEILGFGFIRYYWRQAIDYIAAQQGYNWTMLYPTPDRPGMLSSYGGVGITRALRYMTRSVYGQAGTDNSRFEGLHSVVLPRDRLSPHARGRRITTPAGAVRNRPTVRNRLSSFGSRVPTINDPSPSAQDQ